MAKKKRRTNDALATNNKARYNYAIAETYEAGIELTGTEIKSVRASKITIGDGFVQVRNGQAWLDNVHISPFEQGNRFNHDPLRSRRLLLHKKEIDTLQAAVAQQGKTIVPLRVYLKHGFAKVLIGVATGKHNYDKRETIKKRDQDRDLHRTMKKRY
ncbi:SsrA-binding protein SmpB [Weissella sagaensis]|jgi:SsrA-binding protein|uniref:SsrA-binding protein n=1 Tax=Weissella sagaensis TaxID=2559928 RepID=A0ABW1RRH6_9LACO|nr:SsrA-binding protein SmpB [Weissella sagaensis]KAA8435101.1 SsrA-binding protein SmpB [Weissella paramesenteroides]MBU7568596.1 SsrA-binding protein SmpB [Weissella hellenica]KAA8438992.1 SsrA-binding protein SmpB [Weissella paramesenteroides]QDJ58412.1 SsrA-binding protein SmpB [Weissella hellenica]QEA57406.1 SsrA-binding protein SmpB [Weissella hellenica]